MNRCEKVFWPTVWWKLTTGDLQRLEAWKGALEHGNSSPGARRQHYDSSPLQLQRQFETLYNLCFLEFYFRQHCLRLASAPGQLAKTTPRKLKVTRFINAGELTRPAVGRETDGSMPQNSKSYVNDCSPRLLILPDGGLRCEMTMAWERPQVGRPVGGRQAEPVRTNKETGEKEGSSYQSQFKINKQSASHE